jgi:hypothetical protein
MHTIIDAGTVGNLQCPVMTMFFEWGLQLRREARVGGEAPTWARSHRGQAPRRIFPLSGRAQPRGSSARADRPRTMQIRSVGMQYAPRPASRDLLFTHPSTCVTDDEDIQVHNDEGRCTIYLKTIEIEGMFPIRQLLSR